MLSQHLRVAHRFETARRTLSGSLSASVRSQQMTRKGFLECQSESEQARNAAGGFLAVSSEIKPKFR